MNRTIYQVRVSSKRGSDLVEQHTNKAKAKRRAKELAEQTGKRHHVLTLANLDAPGLVSL